MNEYEILETWSLSIGFMACIKFFSKQRPQIGSIIIYKGHEYKITGYMTHATPHEANIRLSERMKEGIYDCLLKPIDN